MAPTDSAPVAAEGLGTGVSGAPGPSAGPVRRTRLTPAVADVRRAVRQGLGAFLDPADDGVHFPRCARPDRVAPAPSSLAAPDVPLVLVALSGGPDSLALAAAVAFEAPRMAARAGAVIVDHGLQEGSAQVAAQAAATARSLGLAPVLVRCVAVGGDSEAAARQARYAALDEAVRQTGARAVLLAHTLDDQAETVLLGLARGSGARSLAGMRPVAGHYLRPLLQVPRVTTHRACDDLGLHPWHDPMNADARYARPRVRDVVLPTLEAQLGPGVAAALARTAGQLAEDADALDQIAQELLQDLCEPAEAGLAIPVGVLAANPPALRHRVIRAAVRAEFGTSLERVHVLAVAGLITNWHGQAALDLPGVRVVRQGGRLVFSAPGRA
ncbi:MAG TPA: tRNA lysidine(34) synthetase TilS [Microbacteriaceae bacterium]|nr:tRNA lysidine(34) synthetase TilS [Microbacteriaceae bacterium]